MAKKLAIPSKELQLTVVGARDAFKASRVQRVTLTTDIPVEDKDELGNPLHVGQSKDTPNITLTFQAFDVGIKTFAALTGADPASYPAGGKSISDLGEMDAILKVKDSVVNSYVKTGHARRLQVRDFSFNYSVDGDSTEEYTAIGSEKRWFKYDVVVDKFVTAGPTFTLSQTPIQLANGKKALSVRLDGGYLTEVTGTPATGEYKIVGTTLTVFDTVSAQLLVVYNANSGATWSDVSDAAAGPAAIRGKDVNILISAGEISRVQSVTINGNLNTQPVKELGNRNIVGYQKQVPTVEGTITVLDTDTDLISLLTYGVVGSGIEWTPGEGCVTSGLPLKIRLVDPCGPESPEVVLKTVYLPSITVVGDAFTSNVNNNATQTFNFRSTDSNVVVYSGSF
jgi:hypothetical protein